MKLKIKLRFDLLIYAYFCVAVLKSIWGIPWLCIWVMFHEFFFFFFPLESALSLLILIWILQCRLYSGHFIFVIFTFQCSRNGLGSWGTFGLCYEGGIHDFFLVYCPYSWANLFSFAMFCGSNRETFQVPSNAGSKFWKNTRTILVRGFSIVLF